MSDEIDYAEHDAQNADAATERRNECGMRVTVVVEWERDTTWSGRQLDIDGQTAEQLKDVLYRVGEMGAQYQTNGTVRVNIEKLGD